MHGSCMCLFDYLVSLAWVFPSLTMVSALPCHFLDNHGLAGFILGWALYLWKVLESSEVVSRKFPRGGVGDCFLCESLDGWVEIGKFLKVW